MPSEELPQFPIEDELQQALPDGSATAGCPTDTALNDFVDGEYKLDDPALTRMLDHLADCAHCEKKLANIRLQRQEVRATDAPSPVNGRNVVEVMQDRGTTRHRTHLRVALALVAAGLVILVASLLWLNRNQGLQTASIDLRLVTRGPEPPSTPTSIVLHRSTVQIRLFLSEEAVEGEYEVGIFAPASQNSPLMTTSGTTTRGNSSEVVQVQFDLGKFQPGPYTVGIRHVPTANVPQSNWVYYPITLH